MNNIYLQRNQFNNQVNIFSLQDVAAGRKISPTSMKGLCVLPHPSHNTTDFTPIRGIPTINTWLMANLSNYDKGINMFIRDADGIIKLIANSSPISFPPTLLPKSRPCQAVGAEGIKGERGVKKRCLDEEGQ